ncbi:MAG TPA: hypothetical protein VMM15_00610 [Bradyrhizobium sp.]|nr:hypothetical protein [Bradyrhizobium sp.]
MLGQTQTDLWIFFHLPKTAGGTIFHSIRNRDSESWPLPDGRSHFAPNEMPARSKRILWQGSHVAYGLHALYRAAPNYVTILREPCERLLSEFFYSSAQNNPLISRPQQERLPAFIRFVEEAPHLNYYCHMFSAYCFEKEGRWDGTPGHALALLDARVERLGFLSSRVDYGTCDPDLDFKTASKHLATFGHVGLYEALHGVADWFARRGASICLNERYHVTDFKPELSDLPQSTRTALLRKTEADRALYEAAIAINRRQVADDLSGKARLSW